MKSPISPNGSGMRAREVYSFSSETKYSGAVMGTHEKFIIVSSSTSPSSRGQGRWRVRSNRSPARGQRAGDAYALLLTAGQALGVDVGLVGQQDVAQQLVPRGEMASCSFSSQYFFNSQVGKLGSKCGNTMPNSSGGMGARCGLFVQSPTFRSQIDRSNF